VYSVYSMLDAMEEEARGSADMNELSL